LIRRIEKKSITVELDGRIAVLSGNLFFAGNGKVGFTIYDDCVKYWTCPDDGEEIGEQDRARIIHGLKKAFIGAGNLLEVTQHNVVTGW
jgi:hypothetical protein